VWSEIRLERGSDEALYRQLQSVLAGRIRAGELEPGTRLPSVRALAKTLSVSPITVVQAYNALAGEGLVRPSLGRGTFVATRPDGGRTGGDDVQDRASPAGGSEQAGLASQVHLRAPRISAMQTLLRPGRRPGVISLAAGTPDPALFPLRTLGRLWGRTLTSEDPRFLQYGMPQGDPQLRDWIAARCRDIGINARPEHILVTSGSQQAIDLITRTFVGPGDYVLVESPTFVTALDLLEGRGANLLGIPVDRDGLNIDVAGALAERYRPRLLYTIPTGQNPTGAITPEDRRRRLAVLARRHNMLILEDDICSEFTYDGDPPHAVKSYDGGGHVVFVLSFSKTLVPGLRVGCVVADEPLLARLLEAKTLADRFTSPLIQRTLWRYLVSSQYPRDLRTARDVYRARRDAAVKSLKEAMPPEVAWTVPAAGFNMWLRLPDGVPASEVFQEALKEGVACALGDLCLPHPPPPSGIRISFADNPEAVTSEGVRRLGRAVARLLASPRREARDAEFVASV
jgi:DNA-binding transcriptional MocR family regulator